MRVCSAAKQAIPDLLAQIEQGNLRMLLDWLRDNIHGRGRLTTMQSLFEEVTGSRLDARFYKRHLESRYLS